MRSRISERLYDRNGPLPKSDPQAERRAYPRTTRTDPVRIHVPPSEGWIPDTVEGDLENLSRGGALVSVYNFVGREQCCLIEFVNEGGIPPVVGNVRRVRPGNLRRTGLGSRYDFLLGVEFNRPPKAIGDLDD